jgi:prolyl-tRNA editing enzyme YbaK/EbsC (Cys-tRNA(Pro) deacylase)
MTSSVSGGNAYGSKPPPETATCKGYANVESESEAIALPSRLSSLLFPMKPAEHPTALRTSQLLREAGIDTHVVEFEQPTRTSVEAAAAIGCSVAEIAKSIVFRGKTSGQAVVVVASGDNRVSETKVAAKLGEPLARADADFVRTATGYAIGGVAPIGHSQPVKLLLDEDLQRFETVWAAAGTPSSVFALRPDQLRSLTGADWADVRL